jgi:hypothetical protein
MTTMNVKDAAGSTVAVEKPLTPGSATMANSRPVVVASDQFVTEDAAAAADPNGPVLMGVRRDTLSTSEVSADGDNIALKATNKGKLHVAAELRLGDTLADGGLGAASAATQRVAIASDQLGTLGQTTMSASVPMALASDQTWPVGTTGFMKKEDVASADGDAGVAMLAVRKATPANSSGTDGDYEFPQISGGYLWVHDNKGLSNKVFRTTFATLTRPANTTAYTAADSISDNATAGSVTALVSGNISDVNDDPIFISEIHINSTDTGLAGKKIRAYLFNTDPTASTGVGAGDNVAYSQKKAGYIGSFMGYLETGFSDGTVGRLVPCFNETNFTQAGGFIAALPVSGARTLYIQYQAVEAFTPSANSTTIIGTAVGWQGRAV